MNKFSANDRQKEIYIAGLSGQKPIIPIDFDALEQKAKSKLDPKAYGYIAGGAGQEHTVAHNRKDFNQWRIQARMLRDVSVRDTSIELFGQRIAGPLLLSPVGVLEDAHPRADVAVAEAAAAMNIPYIFSNQASRSMEVCGAAMGDRPHWFQLYWSKSNELVKSLITRAEQSGCSAIVVTLDTTMLGWRVQDLDFAYLPFLHGKGIAQYISDPVFNALLDEPEDPNAPKLQPKINLETIGNVFNLMRNYPGGFFKNIKSKRPLKAVKTFIDIYSRPSLTWEDLAFLRKHTDLPILLKGILHPNDAKQAVDYGINGLIVSNHGGRQIDGSVSSIAVLPSIIEAVNGALPVLLDSGVRTGADMFKALALGAKAVCIGRPYVYGLALEGRLGVEEVIKNMLADFELTMGLAGCKSVLEIDRGCLFGT